MTQYTGSQSTFPKSLLLTGGGMLAVALLAGCSTADAPAPSSDADASATAASTPAESFPATTETGSPAASEDTSSAAATASGEDPVFAAIDALLAEHGDAVIVEVDLDDDDQTYEIEAVIDDRVVDFDVSTDGSVREDDDDDDDEDDIRRAGEAEVTAADAARAALEGRDGQTIDDMELDEEDGTLRWDIDLDREGGEDGDEVYVDATTGEVVQDD